MANPESTPNRGYNPTQLPIRKIKAIGVLSIVLPLSTCVYRSKFCAGTCYTHKAFKMYPETRAMEAKLRSFWSLPYAEKLAAFRKALKHGRKRIRLADRGEFFGQAEHVQLLRTIAIEYPEITFWVPTRSWRNSFYWQYVKAELGELANVRILCSIDPSNTPEELDRVKDQSTMFYGNDTEHPFSLRVFRCPKTWDHKEGHCANCRNGCFSSAPVHVWLQQH